MSEPQAALNQAGERLQQFLKQPRTQRWAKYLAIFMVVFGILGYFAAPPLLKSILLDQLSAELNRQVKIEQIDINPYALSLKVSGLSVINEAGEENFGLDELYVNLSSASLFKFGAVVDELRLNGPRVRVSRLGDGHYDISDLLDKWLAPKEPSPTPRFSLNNIQITRGSIVFTDQPVDKVHTVDEIQLAIPFLSSLPYQAEILVEPYFAARVLGAPFELKGKTKPFSPSHESELNLALNGFELGWLQAYLPATLPFKLPSAAVDTDLKLVFKQQSEQLFSLFLQGEARISHLQLQDRLNQPLLGWQQLAVSLGESDLVNQQFVLNAVTLNGLDIQAHVSKQGDMNWLRLLSQLQAPAASQSDRPAASPSKLAWRIARAELNDGRVRWLDESNAPAIRGELKNLNLRVGAVDSKLAAPILLESIDWQLDFAERLQLEQFALKNVSLDLASQRLRIGEISNKKTSLRMTRRPDGALDWLRSPQLKVAMDKATPAKEGKAGSKVEKPWVAEIDKLQLADIMLRLDDQASTPAAVQVLDGLTLTGENLSNEPGTRGKLMLKTRINQKGSLQIGGQVQLQPLLANLNVETQALPLLPFQPYFTDFLNIALTRGQLSNLGEVELGQGKDGLSARYKGSVALGDLLAVDKINNADFLRWKSLYVGGIDFQLKPMSVQIGEIALSDFYSRLIVGSNGQLNLANIVKKPAGEATQEKASGATTASEDKPPIPIKIAKVTLQGGTVNFSDFFVKPNYSANLTRLGGRITGLSSTAGTVADMDIRASYASAAPVTILAKLNPLAAQSYLDLKAEVRGVDLVPFSPYSGKYAGYNIAKGKLSLDVAYKLENKKLDAENRLFIDQLTFGEKVDSPTATGLPVNLAIALLKNSRGEIDLNLPISGTLDDPEFSIGGLVVKVIVNLFVKAVTSPFALLGSIFGGGEELSHVEFAVGRAQFSDAATKKLEALAKAMRDREALKLEITGRIDPETDQEGLKRVAVARAVRVEKQKEMIKKGRESVSLEALEVSDAEYPLYLEKAYKETKFPKPRNVVGLLKDLPVEEMEKLMLTHFPATPEDLRQLALRRAELVQSWLLEQGKVPQERIFLLPVKLERDEKSTGSRVDFSLR